jgi:hypothetical protein
MLQFLPDIVQNLAGFIGALLISGAVCLITTLFTVGFLSGPWAISDDLSRVP